MRVCASVPSPAAGLFQWTDRPTGSDSDREGGLWPTDRRETPDRPSATDIGQPAAAMMMMRECVAFVCGT